MEVTYIFEGTLGALSGIEAQRQTAMVLAVVSIAYGSSLRVIHEKSYPFSPHPPAPSPKMGEGEPDSKSLSRSGRGI
jgi:hypothetical protein